MGTGKKKIEIEKIMKETSRMVTFSKRRKGLFKKAKELESMTGSRVASVVFSPTGRPYTCGDVNSAIKQHFSTTRCRELLTSDCGDINFAIKPHFASTRCMELLTSGLNSHDSDSDSDDVVFDVSLGSKSSSTPKRNGLRCWVEGSNPDSNDDESSQQIPSAFTDVNLIQEDEKFQLELRILNLEGEIASVRHKERSLDDKRREALNKILDIKGCIRVFSRVRPFLPTGITPRRCYVFAEVEPIIRSAFDGHNVCILAYGQTGTGKTYTMLVILTYFEGITESPGIIPRVLQELFNLSSLDGSSSFTFSISMLEVYLGSIRDLLAPRPSSQKYTASRWSLPYLVLPYKGGFEIDGLTEVEISNFTKEKWWYHKGRRVRSTSWTNVNETSSGSHCLTRISIYRYGDTLGGKPEATKLWMIDLGGSERLLKTGATGQTLDVGRAINLSLSALGDVIAAFRRKKGGVPYRNSKLAQVLKDALGDKSKVLMVVHVSPYEEDVGETTCSCTFAKRARAAECNRELSEAIFSFLCCL
ncbi:hypothetical protein MTR67_005214 [Solanum verrucosum]|uniref:MADS-box domain-containing protein n=1 Tax=Solanum verrucosum TaxID=315347 RepID=A0AAF0TB73_SOLVR|nr:hypothetical protein MTR67_005214 [Solanum verrucosum]